MTNSTLTTPTATAPVGLKANVIVNTDNFSLTKHDRCDACASQAYFKVIMKSGSELTFCNHHYRASEGKLLVVAQTIVDESILLTGDRKSAGNGFA